MKQCSKCKQTKLFSDFGKHSKNKDGLQYYCKTCRKEVCSASFKKISEQTKEKRHKVSQKWKKENLEKVKAYAKEYRQTKKAKRTSLERKRQLSKIQRTPKWLSSFDLVYIECLYQVAAMRTKESGESWHVDHVIPLQGKNVSGLHVPSNLKVIPAKENLQKSNKYGF